MRFISGTIALLTLLSFGTSSFAQTVSSDSVARCPLFSRNLSFGTTDSSTGGKVSALQGVLNVSQTGYFGSVTLRALKDWQASHGIVSSGSPSTTGFGFLGPKTRSAMALCPVPVPPTEIIPVPQIQSITPSLGGAAGTVVTIYGIGFVPDTNTVLFNGQIVATVPADNSGTSIHFAIPALPIGSYTLTVQNTQGTSNSVSYSVLLVSQPPSNTSSSIAASTDSASPVYTIASGGTTGVTLAVIKLRAINEAINLQKLGLVLSSGTPGDLSQVYIYAGNNVSSPSGTALAQGTLLGTAAFTGNNLTAISTLVTAAQLPNNTDATLIIKGDIAPIGTSQPGVEGDLVKVNYQSAQGVGVSSGTVVSGESGDNAASGVRIFKTYPAITPDTSLPSGGLVDGRLMLFKVTADTHGPVGIGQFTFAVLPSSGVSLTNVGLNAYVDPAYSMPINNIVFGYSQPTPLPDGSTVYSIQSGNQNNPLEIPPGQTYYFKLSASVSGGQTGSSVITTLRGDSSYVSLQPFSPTNPSLGNFIWSPNATSSSLFATNDWTNGYRIMGLPATGITQIRSQSVTPPPSMAPTISYISPSSAVAGGTVYMYGTNFDQYSFIAIDGNFGPAIISTIISPTSLSFVIPPNTAVGSHTLQVSEKAGNFGLSNAVTLTVGTPPTPTAPAGYGYIFCAMEGQRCTLPQGSVDVIYGYTAYMNYKNGVTASSIDCNNTVFGDPMVGTTKACFYKPASAPSISPVQGYTRCASETQYCSFSGVKDVAYGWNDSFTYKTNVTEGILCDNSVFGDPKYGFTKACYIKDSSTQPPINTSAPRITYTGQSASAVTVEYYALPANTQIVLVNQGTGALYTNTQPITGTGTLSVPLDFIPSGAYYLRALDAGGNYLSQTVTFYVDNPLPATRKPITTPMVDQMVLGASTYKFMNTLQLGSQGADVSALQQILSTEGFLNPTDVSGYFGSRTQAALKLYQLKYGIPSAGILGPLTRQLLNK